MKKIWSKIIVICASSLVVGGIDCGIIFGLAPLIEETVEAYTPEPEEIPSVVTDMFTEIEVASVEEITDYSSSYINSAYLINASGSESTYLYYDLTSASGFYTNGKVEFAIGVTDNVVSHYNFIKNAGEDSLGANQASSSSTLFVGYSLDGTIDAGITASYTYAGMEKAVIAALTDAQGR